MSINKAVEILGDILLAAFALSILLTLCFILVYGSVKVFESRDWVLYTEIALAVASFGIAVDRFIRDAKN